MNSQYRNANSYLGTARTNALIDSLLVAIKALKQLSLIAHPVFNSTSWFDNAGCVRHERPEKGRRPQ